MSGESEDESKGRLIVCCVLVDVIILGLFGWSKFNCFIVKLVVVVGEEFILGKWELSHK
jgi:hypothetical protein